MGGRGQRRRLSLSEARTRLGLPRRSFFFGLPDEAVVALPASGETLYRLVDDDPPPRRSFLSRAVTGKGRLPGGQAAIFHSGLSMFAEQDQAISRSNRSTVVVARVQLDEGLGFYVAKTLGRGHFTVWGDARELRDRAEVVYHA